MQSNIWQIVPIIDGYIYLIQQQDSWLQLMQDGAGHASQKILSMTLLSVESIPSHGLPSHLILIQLRWYRIG